MKGLKVTEIAKETGFKGLWGELGPGGGGEGGEGFPGSAGHRVFEATLVFMWGSALWEKFVFFNSFLLPLAKFSIWQWDWALGYHSKKSRHSITAETRRPCLQVIIANRFTCGERKGW